MFTLYYLGLPKLDVQHRAFYQSINQSSFIYEALFMQKKKKKKQHKVLDIK